ncbi:MAG TPA: hypothetical protein VMZ71_05930 [Gemmataceae bacterium]|nr:hypothetical protein [Gemmataceae bacterium]
MKCVNCGKDSNYKERSGKQCPHCKKAFAFEPKGGDKVTDMLFQNAIAAVSGEGRIRWGVEHLYYEVCRRKRGKAAPLGCIAIALVVFVFCAAMMINGLRVNPAKPPFFFIGSLLSGVVLLGLVATLFRSKFVAMEREEFNRYWTRWTNVMGKPSGLIERVPEPKLPADLEADIGDYSFDRAVICDRARTVDLLVANNFHFENNCAVLSFDGYPKGVFGTIRTMLKKNPKLQVFVLHDATIGGCNLAQRLITDPHWFGGSGLRVIDLGLRPQHAGPFKGLLLRADGPMLTDEPGITAGEAQWLSRHTLELAAVRPEQVLKRLFAGLMAHANDDPRTGDSSGAGAVTTCGAFDAGGYGGDGADGLGGEGGADAFG